MDNTEIQNMHLRALKRATDAGDTEAADYIRQQLIKSYQDADPAAGESVLTNLAAGTGAGAMNVIRGAGNMVGLVPDEDIKAAHEIDKPLMNTKAGKIGEFAGEMAATAVPGAGVGVGLAKTGAKLGGVAAKVASNLITRGAAEGAAQGAILADPGHRGEGAVLGAAGGAVLPVGGAAYRAARSGVRPTKNALRLMKEGVDLTPGQMNPQGVMNKVEQMPVISDIVAPARNRAEQQFQRASVQKAAPPGTSVAQGKPDAMLDQVYQSFSPLYDQARGFPVNDAVLRKAIGVPNVSVNGQQLPAVAALGKALSDATLSRGVRATDPTRAGVDKFLQEQLTAISNRKLTSDDLLELRSAIRTEGRNARLSVDPQEQAAADLFKRAEDVVTNGIKASISKDAVQALDVGDQHYRIYKVLEDAVYRAADRPKGFTPNDLSMAVRKSTQKGTYARGGGGDLRGMAAAGRESLDSTEPKTGYALGKLAALAASGLAAPKIAIPAALGAVGLSATKTGRKLAAGQNRLQLLGRELERTVRRNVPAPVRGTVNRYARTALITGLSDHNSRYR